jgi:hypothetical protein
LVFRETNDCRIINGVIVTQIEDLEQPRTLDALLSDNNDEYSHESKRRPKEESGSETNSDVCIEEDQSGNGETVEEEAVNLALRADNKIIGTFQSLKEYALLNCLNIPSSRVSDKQI